MKMKNIFILLGVVMILVSAACKKSSPADPSGGANFQFTSLVATDTVVKVNAITTLKATAVGDGLTYSWTSLYGTFLSNGATQQWTVCHEDKFSISCTVTDKYNHSETKQVIVRSVN